MHTEQTTENTATGPAAPSKPLLYTRDFEEYNGRRYSAPWAAKITLSPDGLDLRYEFVRGAYQGDDGGGELQVMAFPGEVFAEGQKDNRGNNTFTVMYKMLANGDVELLTKAKARRYLQSLIPAPVL